MKKFLVLVLLATILAGCGAEPALNQSSVVPTNEMVYLKEENFAGEMEKLILQIGKFEPEISGYLSRCEIGITDDQGYGVQTHGDDKTCVILFVSDKMTQMAKLQMLAKPQDVSDSFAVAVTQDMLGSDYPVIFVGEYELDQQAWVRVIAHEGFHVMSLKKGTASQRTQAEEEAAAFGVQFSILEKLYGEEKASKGPDAYKLPSDNAWYSRFLGMEAYVYKTYKSGSLVQELIQMGYGSDT